MPSWIHYWSKTTFLFEVRKTRPLIHTASNNFRDRRVKAGDGMYVISCFDNSLHLAGGMTVEQILLPNDAHKVLGYGLWDASDHAIATRNTVLIKDRIVPAITVRKFRFLNSTKGGLVEAPLLLNAKGNIEPQQFRNDVRQITPGTAALLDRLLK